MIIERSLKQLNHDIVFVSSKEAYVILDVNISPIRVKPSMLVISTYIDSPNDYDMVKKCIISTCVNMLILILPPCELHNALYLFKNKIALSWAVFTIYRFIDLISEQNMLNLYNGAA